MHSYCRNLVLRLALWILPVTAAADSLLQTEHTRVNLLSEQQQIRPGHSFWVALQLTPEPGWHTYWKNPGDSGKATSIRWELPPGLRAGDIHWPLPERIRTGSLVSYGYTGTVNLLTEIDVSALAAGNDIEITAAADWLVCEDICIPEKAVLTLSLPAGPAARVNQQTAPLFSATRNRLPRRAPWTASYIYKDNELVFDIPLTARGLEYLSFFPVEDNLIENSSDQSFLLGRNSIRISAEAGYRRQTGPFHGVLVSKGVDQTVEAMEFTAQPVTRLPDVELVTRRDND